MTGGTAPLSEYKAHTGAENPPEKLRSHTVGQASFKPMSAIARPEERGKERSEIISGERVVER